MKREIKFVDGTPNKRLFWSIISDYSLNTSICELIDNALDIWLKNGKKNPINIVVDIDVERKVINIQDNAGGVPENEHQVLISPGASLNNPNENIIGLFGVGSKRAVVALAEDIKIRTRHGDGRSFQLDIDEHWLESDNWEMPVYETSEIPSSTTSVDLVKLRFPITTEDIERLSVHLSETYSQFLKRVNFDITLNGEKLNPIEFDKWAYPPGFEPRYYMSEISTSDGEKVGVELYAGLISNKEPGKDDYGVYFYCNERLITKEVKDREVGYLKGFAGTPHSDASLARVIVKLYGPAKLMPWNSTKSSINFGHHIFKGLHNILIPVVTDFSSLSRRFKGQWEEEVFKYTEGEMKYLDIEDVKAVRRSFLPPLPKVRKQTIDHFKINNRQLIQEKPWVLGLLESIAAVEIISRQKLETRNRIALILLDSTFEIALKEYIVHTNNLNLGGRTLEQVFERRDEVIRVVNQKIRIDGNILLKIQHYYRMRNKLIHERATVDVVDGDISNYLETVQYVLSLLFGIQF